MKTINLKRKIGIVLVGIVFVALTLGFVSITDKDFKIAKNLDIFYTLFRELNLYYVDDTDPEKLINSSIEGMLKSLDPYTSFIPESEMENFNFMTTGEYGGIGALIRKGGKFTIISEPYKGFPAYKVGLKAGDTIISIDGNSTLDKNITDVSELLKGAPNTSLRLKIKRCGANQILEKTLKREKITIKNVPYFGMIDSDIGYIKLSNFTKGAGLEVREALNNLKKQGVKSVILDLRGNTGGLLVESVNVANIFIGKGKEIVSTKGRIEQWDNHYETKNHAVDTLIPLVVLVNRASASASEIVAGSMQDLDRAIIIGQKTFGKGLVQTTRPLSYNTQLKVTTAKYYIPSGRCIQTVDYSNRNEDGSVGHVPDSLISEFKTKNGRTVFDGGGISPDITFENNPPGNITISLYTKNIIFDYATIYASRNDSIAPLESFTISDNEYTKFLNYLKGKDFDYTTRSDDQLDELIKTAKQEKYYEHAKNEFDALKVKLAHDKNKDLQTFKDEIKSLLAEEIASRFYYQEGRVRTSLNYDIQLTKAIEVLKDQNKYFSILTNKNYTPGIFAMHD
jgi:carboxyl-terminal processing protease